MGHFRFWPAIPLVSALLGLAACSGSSKLAVENAQPPSGAPTSTEAAICATAPRDPGRVTVHRLNRAEYNNTVRDLLSDTTAPARDFPDDDSGYGFDNIADVLSIGPLLLEKYQSAAEQLINAAWDRDIANGTTVVRICDPNADSSCARQVLTRFALRAWRRPAESDEIDRYLALVSTASGQQDPPDVGVKLALQAMLVSPHFLYRVELDTNPDSPTAHPLNERELASRLSYFLWSSMPDDELMARASDGTLHDPAVLEQQVRRMLRDPKAAALRQNFAGEWLYTRAVDGIQPNSSLFPTFDSALRGAMRQETEMFFQSLLDENRSVLDLLGADYTFLNDRLADHYGLPSVGGSTLRRVVTTGTNRGGILTQASFLTVTSQPNRTSPVKRGKFVLGQLLCTEPPPPPPNVPPLPEGSGQGTLRQRLEAHRSNPACASCHSLMDPIGFGLENFDGIGKWRDRDTDGSLIDATGVLPDNKTFNGAKELAAALKTDPRLPGCVVSKVFTYALGRGPTAADACAIEDITRAFESRGNRLADLFVVIATSAPFVQRRGEPGATP